MLNKQRLAELHKGGIYITNASFGPKVRLWCEPPVAIAGEIHMSGRIGAYSYIRKGRLSGGIRSIGRYCSIAPGVVAGDGNHPTDWLSTHPFQWGLSSTFVRATKKRDYQFLKPQLKTGPTTIGHDVWVGANAMIMPGIKVADGAIIAAGSVVTKDVPPYAIVAGVPARILRYRFDDPTIEALLRLQWWRFEADSLLGVDFSRVGVAIEQIRAREENGELTLITAEPVQVSGAALRAA